MKRQRRSAKRTTTTESIDIAESHEFATPEGSGSGELGIASESAGSNEGHEIRGRAPITVRLYRPLWISILGLVTAPVPAALYITYDIMAEMRHFAAQPARGDDAPPIASLSFLYAFLAVCYFSYRIHRARSRRIMVVRNRRIEFFWKDRSKEKSVSGWIPWSRVQAIVTTPGSVAIYLSTDPENWDSVKDSIPVSSRVLRVPPTPDVDGLVTFPAVEVALNHSRGRERRRRHLSKAALSAPHTSHTVPDSQVRYALWAFRPDLCHGFEDIAETTAGDGARP